MEADGMQKMNSDLKKTDNKELVLKSLCLMLPFYWHTVNEDKVVT